MLVHVLPLSMSGSRHHFSLLSTFFIDSTCPLQLSWHKSYCLILLVRAPVVLNESNSLIFNFSFRVCCSIVHARALRFPKDTPCAILPLLKFSPTEFSHSTFLRPYSFFSHSLLLHREFISVRYHIKHSSSFLTDCYPDNLSYSATHWVHTILGYVRLYLKTMAKKGNFHPTYLRVSLLYMEWQCAHGQIFQVTYLSLWHTYVAAYFAVIITRK